MSINHEQDGDISLTSSHASAPPIGTTDRAVLSNGQSTPRGLGSRQSASNEVIPDRVRDRMQRWVQDIVVCNFDLETGPVVERSLLRIRRSKREVENLAFSSFPDTSLFSEGSIKFSFRTRQSIDGAELTQRSSAEEYREWNAKGGRWLYGYVWFEQRRDPSISRGYMQKSVVVLSHTAHPDLYFAALDKVAPAYFLHGSAALEAACHDIARWPDVAYATQEMPMACDMLAVDPSRRTKGLNAVHRILPHLWSLWECVTLAEPILVMSSDPKTCSEIIWWLHDIVQPINPVGDFRPYLHMQDRDCNLLMSGKPQSGVMVGVTNPFFQSTSTNWPNVLVVGKEVTFNRRRQRSVGKDRQLLSHLEGIVGSGRKKDALGGQQLDDYFRDLTERFLVPLYRYNHTRGREPWSTNEFLASLNRHGPNPLRFRSRGLNTKTRVESNFYASFCMSGNFASWLLELEAKTPVHFEMTTRPSNESELSAAQDRRMSEDSPVKASAPRRGSVL